MLSKRKTKQQILSEGGYVAPITGRPTLYGEKSALIQFRIPGSLSEKLGKTTSEKNEKAREIVINHLARS